MNANLISCLKSSLETPEKLKKAEIMYWKSLPQILQSHPHYYDGLGNRDTSEHYQSTNIYGLP